MEKLLEKLARQLDSLDEASLMALWSKYATKTSRFEPTKRWEEACLVFSLIQAKHFKNQLFNYCWQQQRRHDRQENERQEKGAAPGEMPGHINFELEKRPVNGAPPQGQGCRVLSFSQDKDMEESPEED